MASAILQQVPLGFVWPTLDPFLFCVHHDDAYPVGNGRWGPKASLAGRNLGQDFEPADGWRMYHGLEVPGFPAHPHRGFETVTVVQKGLVDHSDSLGAAARYGRGDVQWLTAGAGIVHAEMFPLVDTAGPNPLELFQIWLNLPRASKMAPPHFGMYWGDRIQRAERTDPLGRVTRVAIIAGALDGLVPEAPPPASWASRPEAEVAIWTLDMEAGARTVLPAASPGLGRMLYFFQGRELAVADQVVAPRTGLRLRSDAAVEVTAGPEPARLLLLQGRPIGEPVVQHGPFVMNTEAEIRQAYLDYQRTGFGAWPWATSAPVHAEEPRFARHADGRTERAG